MRDIIEKLALKYDLPVSAIDQMIVDTWKGVKKEMSTRHGKNIILTNFGLFSFKEAKLDRKIQEIKEKIQDNEDRFKNGRKPWRTYIKVWMYYNKKLNTFQYTKDMIEKRKLRQPGERGL